MPGSAGAIRAGKAYVEIGGDTAPLNAVLKRVQAKLQAFGTAILKTGAGLAGAGAAMLAPMIAAAHSFAEAGSALNDMSARTGVSVEALSELGYAADQTGASIDDVETAVKKMQKTIVAAAGGSKEAREQFTKLGLSLEDLQRMKPEDQFSAIAERLNGIVDPTQRAAAAMALFGKQGSKLLPMIAEMDELRQKARALGLVMTTEDAAAADALGDAMDTLSASFAAIKNQIGAALAPALTQLFESATRIGAGVIAWVRGNRELVVSAAKVALGIVALGGVVIAAGAAFIIAAKMIGAVLVVGGAVTTAVGAIGSALAFLVSPIGLVITAFVAAGTAIVVYSGAAGEAVAWLGDRFQELMGVASEVVGGVVAALNAGDVALAAQIMWTTLQLAWTKGIAVLNGAWVSVKRTFLVTLNEATAGARVVWENVVDFMATSWISMTAGLQSTWEKFSAWHQNTVESTANWIAKRWAEVKGAMDDSFNVEQAKADIDAMSAQQHSSIDSEKNARLAAIEEAHQKALKLAKDEHEDQLRKINEQADATEQSIKSASDTASAALSKKLEELQAKLKEQIDAAKKEGAAGGPGRANLRRPDLPDLAGITQQAQQKLSVAGTFNASAAFGLAGGGDAADRTAKASEKTAAGVERLVQSARVNKLVFTGG